MDGKNPVVFSYFQKSLLFFILFILFSLGVPLSSNSVDTRRVTSLGQPAQLEVRLAGERSLRLTLKPLSMAAEFPFSPALAERPYPRPAVSLGEIRGKIKKKIGPFSVEIFPEPLGVVITNEKGKIVQVLVFTAEGHLIFKVGNGPVLGLGEGGPQPGENWREHEVEFDRRGRFHEMRPRWQSNCYGSRNPVPLLIGTAGWAFFVATPWVHVDLRDKVDGRLIPWQPPQPPAEKPEAKEEEIRSERNRYIAQTQGRPPVESIISGFYDLFIFDAHEPVNFMKDLTQITGPAVLPPRWALGYMQSHRTLEDENQMIEIVKVFREKRIPVDAVIYLGTGFCPRGWNTPQPSFEFNPEVFKSDPKKVIEKLHRLNVKVVLHIVPWGRDKLPTLLGTIPPATDEKLDNSHIFNYWMQHIPLVEAGVDGWWPDEGDWFNLFERLKRHQLYYQGPLFTQPNRRPWSLHRNGYLGIARWGGWVWSGDTTSAWKTLEGQIAVGLNHFLSLSPYWGSDIGGFYPNEELTGELYVRWFQFGAFCPSFRSHGRTWWTRLPWGWGLAEMGPLENPTNPLSSELNNPQIEPICRRFAELRYQLLPYTYTLAWEARATGLPIIRAMWLHYPDDPRACLTGNQYLWGRDLLIAPVFKKGACEREVYLPEGLWYDFWENRLLPGGRTVGRKVDLSLIPIYVRAGAIIPFDPVRQFTEEKVDKPMTIKIYQRRGGEFTLYEDDGISLDYLKGKATWTKFKWDDEARRLTIEPDYHQGMQAEVTQRYEREFVVELIPEGLTRKVRYQGKRVVIAF